MSAVSETIVREFFESRGFLVRQQRKYIARTRPEDDLIDFFIFNPQPDSARSNLPFVLSAADVSGLERGVVVVKGYHTETFSPGVLAGAPNIYRFVDPAVFKRAARTFGLTGSPTKILVVPALPPGETTRAQSIELLRTKGVDALIPFRVMLSDLIDRVETNRNYRKSDLLQMLRILKNYDFFKEPQLELFRPRRRGGGTNTTKWS